jgi:hypothetical protein
MTNIFDTTFVSVWLRATKTMSIKAKPLITLMVDRSVMSKFLVDTLEGQEPLGDGAVICIGQHNDAWQQTPSKLLAKYDVKGIDADGWMLCDPRPDNAVECFEITEDVVGDLKTGYIIGQWGGTLADGTKNAQSFVIGDYVVRNPLDRFDQWIVRRKIFINTYSIKD